MEKKCVASFYIKLSDKATAIPLPENEFLELVRIYRDFSREKALEVLFRFKYGTRFSKEEAFRWFVQKTDRDGTTVMGFDPSRELAGLTDEQLCLLTDELRLQYQARDTLFLDIHSIRGLPSGCHEELEALQEKMSDPVLIFKVIRKCVKAKKNPNVSQWVVQLLSNSSASHSIALERLGFDFNYRVQLKPFSNEIGALLFAMHQIYLKRVHLLTGQNSFSIRLITLLKQMIELDKVKHADDKMYHHSDKVSYFENMAVELIEASSHVACDDPRYSTFIESLEKLEKLGNSIVSLLKSQIEYISFFSKGENEDILYAVSADIKLGKKMCILQEGIHNAQAGYSAALADFKQFSLNVPYLGGK